MAAAACFARRNWASTGPGGAGTCTQLPTRSHPPPPGRRRRPPRYRQEHGEVSEAHKVAAEEADIMRQIQQRQALKSVKELATVR